MTQGPTITLLTDFGLRDGYVGAMKGVLRRLAPEATIVDICHEIPPQDIARAGVVWSSAVPYFPRGSVHVGVVDPGVGTSRRILAVETARGAFLAPDNGLLGYVLRSREIRRSVCVRREELFLKPVSRTFHGRDIFAPAAAHLARGSPLSDLGPAARPARWARLPAPRRSWRRDRRGKVLEMRGEIVTIDAFGNSMTNLPPESTLQLESLRVGSLELASLSGTYGDVARSAALVLVGSSGYLEVAVRDGHAADEHGISVGDRVVARWRRPRRGRRVIPASPDRERPGSGRSGPR